MDITFEDLDTVNRCQIAEMETTGRRLDPAEDASCEHFEEHVHKVEGALVHTYQLVAFKAVRESDPARAAEYWRLMVGHCDRALAVLSELRERFPDCGTHELHELALEYRLAAAKRLQQNLEDAEWQKTPIPDGLFQTKS